MADRAAVRRRKRAGLRPAHHPSLAASVRRAVAFRLLAVGVALSALVAVDVGLAATTDTGRADIPSVTGR